MTLILSSVILLSVGLKGDFGMYAALMIGGVVCTALSMAGGFITDLKIGYWIGSTPWNQERFKFIGVLVSSISVVLMIILLNDKFGFVATPEHKDPLVAPQANAMATVLKSLLSTETVPWMLLGIGVMIAIVLELAKVPALAFALGMYIPQELNVPLIIGGFIAYLVAKSTKDEKLSTARKDKGTLIASGFIAGGAIMGVFSTVLKAIEIKGKSIEDTLSGAFNWADKPIGEVLGFVAFALVIAYLLFVSLRIKKTKT
jgi:putative OPT family oligopeptide transporter